MTTLTEVLNNSEEHYPGNFDTPERANALLTGLCQDAAIEIKRLQDEVLEQCRIIGMSAEREDALRAEVERLNKAQKREWVDLTDEDFQWVYDHGRTPAGMMEMVEAKLKEKNQ